MGFLIADAEISREIHLVSLEDTEGLDYVRQSLDGA